MTLKKISIFNPNSICFLFSLWRVYPFSLISKFIISDSSIFIKSIIDDISVSNYNNLKKTGSFKNYSTSNTNYSKNNIVFIQQFDEFKHIKNDFSSLNIITFEIA